MKVKRVNTCRLITVFMASMDVEPLVCKVCGREFEATASTSGEFDPETHVCRGCTEGKTKVLVRMYDGTERRYPQGKVFRGNYRLMMENGNIYHTHVNCYLNWNRAMLIGFTGWKLIPKGSAEHIGKCLFCTSADEHHESGFMGMPVYDWEDYEGREPIGRMVFESNDPGMSLGNLLIPGKTNDV